MAGHAGDGLTVASRRRYFQNAAHRHMTYSMDFVWTFHLWQEYIDYASYMLNLGYSTYDLTQHLDGQPLQVSVACTCTLGLSTCMHLDLELLLQLSKGAECRRRLL